MYLAYTDDSGDSGFVRSRTTFFVISCVLIHESQWRSNLDRIIALRQELKKGFNIPVRSELKAVHFIYGRGPLKNMRPQRRIELFERVLGFEAHNLEVTNFAVAIAKERIKVRQTNNPRDWAWTILTQRLDTFCRKHEPPGRVILLPDEGHGPLVRKIMRKARRFQIIKGFYGGQLDIPAAHLVEDPFDKQSSESYFTQLADWNAYAAHRYREVDPVKRAPSDLWDRLGNTRLLDVNELTGGPPGIVVWPREDA